MITWLVVVPVLAVMVLALWAVERADQSEAERHGIDSFPCPPPIPCSCPTRHLGRLIVDGAPHVPPCAFADWED